MIKEIRLKNFLSIQDSLIEFSPTGITTLIGANSSGKSNLVKAIEFIAEICNTNLLQAINNLNGKDGIIPKSLPNKQYLSANTFIGYTIQLRSPLYYPKDAPLPKVTHDITIYWNKKGPGYHILNESLTYYEPITTSKAVELERKIRNTSDKDIDKNIDYIPSTIKIERHLNKIKSIILDPPVDENNVDDYFSWFGLSFLDQILKTHDADTLIRSPNFFVNVIDILGKTKIKLHPRKSLIDDNNIPLVHYSDQNRVFRYALNQIKRYDLQLAELRKEQPISAPTYIGKNGQYVPSVLRKIIEAGNNNDILETLSNISPYISDLSINKLKSGKEYIEFIENKLGRPVESWSSSDGTLRTLAILIAINTCENSHTIIIEEPEQCLHPWAIPPLMRHIRDYTDSNGIQVIITTHSQQVLEAINPDEAIVVNRKYDIGTIFSSVSNLYPSSSIDMGEIGRMWAKGLLGGVPEYD